MRLGRAGRSAGGGPRGSGATAGGPEGLGGAGPGPGAGQGGSGGPRGAQGGPGGPRGAQGGQGAWAQGGPGGPQAQGAQKNQKSRFLSTRAAWPGLRPPGPWTCCGEGPPPEMPAPSRVKGLGFGYLPYKGDQYWSPGKPAPVPSWLQEAGKRPGSTFAIEVEGLKRRPPSVGGRPRP